MIPRRTFLTGLVSLVAAPAIVRYTSIMPVKSMPTDEELFEMMKVRIMAAYTLRIKEMNDLLYGTPAMPLQYGGFSLLFSNVTD